MKTVKNQATIFRHIQSFLITRLVTSPPIKEGSLLYWRVQILSVILIIGLVLGFFVLVISSFLAFKEKLWGLACLNLFAFLSTLYILVSQRLMYETRAIILLIFFYAIGLGVTLSVGPLSGGPAWLFGFPIFAGILLGSKAAVVAIGINASTLTIIGWLIHSGRFGQEFPFFSTLEAMIAAGINYLFLNTVTAVTVSVLIKGLVSMHRKEKALASDLQYEHEHHIKTKKELELEAEGRIQVAETLRHSEIKYRNIIESIEDGYYEVDLSGNVTYLNKAGCKMFGYSKDEILGMNMLKSMSEKSVKGALKTFRSVLKTEIPTKSFDWIFTKKDGSRSIVDTSVSLIRDSDYNPIGFRGISRDVTERKRVEAELRRTRDSAEKANQAKSEFLANMSHELRTPLNHIIGFTELVVDKNFGELNEVQQEYLNDTLHSSRHLLSLINDILDLSKVEAGKPELNPTDVNLKELLENSLMMIKEKAMKNGIQLSIEIDGIPETIWADERKLKQIVYNLLSNAVKFTPDGGRICLMSKKVTGDEWQMMNLELPENRNSKYIPGDFIEISVTDTGIGLKPKDLERIFSPFEQVENSASRRFQGTGLGLSLTISFVQLHGGKILARSVGEGEGSTFSLILPISPSNF